MEEFLSFPVMKATKREQVRRACVRCAGSKRKCSGTFPCERCDRLGLAASCVEVTLKRKSHAGVGVGTGATLGGSTRPLSSPCTSASAPTRRVETPHDVPCTGLGALRRRPEARWRRTPADVPTLVKLQRELLAAAIVLTRPGGVILYATCSPNLAETIGVVSDALRKQPVTAVDARPLFAPAESLGDGPYVQLWPHRHGTDAMFAAVLTKNSQPLQ
jgi:hypothetical protein